jgi:hypothetical protein
MVMMLTRYDNIRIQCRAAGSVFPTVACEVCEHVFLSHLDPARKELTRRLL